MKVAFCTLGCKVNFYETEKMMSEFKKAGFEVIDKPENADVYVINTCTVTNMADRKSRQMIHRGKKKNPECLVVAVGCYAESDGEKLKNDKEIDLVLSNKEKERVVDFVCKQLNIMKDSVEEEKNTNFAGFSNERTRAFVKVQSGCNQFCTYCIIPFVRGKLYSRDEDEILEEIEVLADQGFQEVVINGIHLSSYGIDKSEKKHFLELEGKPLLSLLARIAGLEKIKRIRLGSLEPRIITEEFTSELSKIEKVCPHFHLSLQSGCDETLQRMNRHYSAAEYKEKCDILRKYYDRPAITTDVIVGFPGETEEEFEKTVAFLEDINLSEMHIFKYSRRDGTKAAVMPDQVTESEKTKRSAVLLAMNERHVKDYRESFAGEEQEVLFEEFSTHDGEHVLTGHTSRYIHMAVSREEAEKNGWGENQIAVVKLEK